MTGVSTSNRSATSSRTACATLAGLRCDDRVTMLPLCTYVRTSSKPASASASRSSGIDTLLWAPRLIPRSNETQTAMGRR